MDVDVIGDTCDKVNVISVVKGWVRIAGVGEHDGFFIISFIRELGIVLCCCTGIKLMSGCYEQDYFFVDWVMIRAGGGDVNVAVVNRYKRFPLDSTRVMLV